MIVISSTPIGLTTARRTCYVSISRQTVHMCFGEMQTSAWRTVIIFAAVRVFRQRRVYRINKDDASKWIFRIKTSSDKWIDQCAFDSIVCSAAKIRIIRLNNCVRWSTELSTDRHVSRAREEDAEVVSIWMSSFLVRFLPIDLQIRLVRKCLYACTLTFSFA